MTEVKAELVGSVWKVKTAPGAEVAEEDELLILESMKMEIPVTAAFRHRQRGAREGG